MTFNAAHNYLGLTTEVLRTEKAINDIACHPLPQSFYHNGLKQLRQRFDGVAISSGSDTDSDYFSSRQSNASFVDASSANKTKSKRSSASSTTRYSPVTPMNSHSSRHFVQAGDLLTSSGNYAESPKAMARTLSSSGTTVGAPTPRVGPLELSSETRTQGFGAADEFDLREEVMSCIAKSIGLIQPPLSNGDSVEASPAFPPSDGGLSFSDRSPQSRGGFRSSFGSLSLLDIGDDASSSRTESSSSILTDGYMSNLDNEVEIRFFPAGSILAKAGERSTGNYPSLPRIDNAVADAISGLFYVIDGFLDMILPVENGSPENEKPKPKQPPAAHDRERSWSRSEFSTGSSHGTNTEGPARSKSNKERSQKPLFTVKPGGIAGYLCVWHLSSYEVVVADINIASLCQTASYVDIVAKTDTYVGYLKSTALERLLERRPIVLLTLAKRLISLLSPLGMRFICLIG